MDTLSLKQVSCSLYRSLGVTAEAVLGHACVVERDALVQARAISEMVQMTQASCAELKAQARSASADLLAEAKEECLRLVFDATLAAQRQVWQQATELLTQLEAERLAMREHAVELLRTMLMQLTQRLLLNVSEVTPALSSVRLLVEAWGHERAVGRASLRLNPDDLLSLTPVLATMPGWQVQPFPGLRRGDCVLVYDGLEMHASFTAHVAALTTAMASAPACLAIEADHTTTLPVAPSKSQEFFI